MKKLSIILATTVASFNLSTVSASWSQQVAVANTTPTVLDRILIFGDGGRQCRPLGTKAEPGEVLPSCTSDGEVLRDLVGTSFDREQIDRLPTGPRVDDIVKRMPAVVTGGAPGEAKDARVLGLDKEYTRTTVDGVPLPDGGEKREFNLDRLASALVESVEVIRGRSAEVEADGIGGRINLRLREIPKKWTWEAQTAIGGSSLGETPHWHAISGGGMLNQNFGLQGAYSFSNGVNGKEKTKSNSAGVLQEVEKETKPLISHDFMADFLLQGDGNSIRFKPKYLYQIESKDKTKDKYKNGVFDGSEIEVEKKTKSTLGGTLSYGHEFSALDGASFEARFSHYAGSEEKDKTKRTIKKDGKEDVAKKELEIESKDDSIWQGDGKFTLPYTLGGLESELKVGGLVRYKDRSKFKQKSVNGAAFTSGVKDKYELEELTYHAFVQNKVAITDWLTITPGVRFEGLNRKGFDGVSRRGEGKELAILPSLPFTADFGNGLKLKGGVSRLVNQPKFDDLIPIREDKGTTIFVGNPDLKAEEGLALDADFTWDLASATFSVGGFYRRIDGIIEEVNTGQFEGSDAVFTKENVGDGWTAGLVLSQRVALDFTQVPVLEGFTILAHQTFADSEVTEKKTGLKRRFKEQPKFWGDVAVEWRDPTERFFASVGVGYTGETAGGDNNGDVRDAEVGVDAQVKFKVNETFEVFAFGENLTRTTRRKVKADGSVEEERGPSSYFVGLKATF
ncbi:MAG: TonB-dependent receptor [Ahrensia sp.]|nr:TonB-dependent receptor [Ahrensia sp.]